MLSWSAITATIWDEGGTQVSTHRKFDSICVAVLACTLLITVLFMNGARLGITAIVDEDAENIELRYFTENDRNGDWNSENATRISLDGDRIKISGGGAYTYDGNVVIAQSGQYVITGTLKDGAVIVNAENNSKVWILLDGADLSCADNACLRIEQADKVFLTLAENAENSMHSGAEYSEEAVAANIGGVIYSRDDLTINGKGSLSITAEYKHGIDVNDELVLAGGSLAIDAVQDAVHVNDGLRIENAEITLHAGDEGMILQGEEALLYIASGELKISCEGSAVKSAGNMMICGGNIEIETAGDGLHSGENIEITDGNLNIKAGDDGIHADQSVTVTGGIIQINECYEGIEAKTIDFRGGAATIYPMDDGFNANGGSGGFGFGMPMNGQIAVNTAADTEEECWIHISGGNITIINDSARDADGLDSNGDIVISGGVTRISLTGDGSNSAIDYGSESGGICEIEGGVLIACGGSAMAESISESSEQCSIMFFLSETAESGTKVSLKDTEGNELISDTIPCSFSSVTLSTPQLAVGESYIIMIDEEETEISIENVSTSCGGRGGFENPGQQHMGGGRMSEDFMPGDFTGDMQMPGGSLPMEMSGESSDRHETMNGAAASEMPADNMGHAGMRPGGSFQNGVNAEQAGQNPPSMSGAFPAPNFPENNGGDMHGNELAGFADPLGDSTENTEQASDGPKPVTKEEWVMVCSAALVLSAGIFYAMKYKKTV